MKKQRDHIKDIAEKLFLDGKWPTLKLVKKELKESYSQMILLSGIKEWKTKTIADHKKNQSKPTEDQLKSIMIDLDSVEINIKKIRIIKAKSGNRENDKIIINKLEENQKILMESVKKLIQN